MTAKSAKWAWAGLAARLILGGVMIVSGASKVSAPKEEFAVVIENYQIVPVDAADALAALLPWVELLLGFAIVLGYFTAAASAAGGGLLAMFIAAILSTKARGIDLPNCGCFGGRFHPSPTTTALMDACLLGAAYVALRFGSARASLDRWSEQP